MQSHQPDGLAINGLGHLTAHNDCLRIINHGRTDIGVPEQFLDRPNVITVLQQVGCKRMRECVVHPNEQKARSLQTDSSV
ncbi:MAG: hypothetical protein A2038_00645 [Deltaproteobacteria bacterium GWA2_57_13]|nr:MAG: hypothetical protein A2038_00645 [Deltaproteobacteria bacterium GWA2_57_13]